VQLSEWIFHLTPPHRTIVLLSEALIFVTALGVTLTLRRRTGGRPGKEEATC
jgi:hypothetical protein